MKPFSLVAGPELAATLSTYASEVVIKEASTYLFRQGDKPHGFYLVKSGTLRLSMEASAGKEILSRTVGQGCLVGLPATVNGQPYSLSCEVVENAALEYLSQRDLTRLMRSELDAAMELLELLSIEVQAVRSEIAEPRLVRTASSCRTFGGPRKV